MAQNNTKAAYGFPLFLIGCLFFIFGFITWSNSQLIPYLKIACELSQSAAYLVATAFFAAYFIMAIPSSVILSKTGYKKGMSLGLFIMSAGALLFIPAANSRSYPLFLTGLFIIGTGLALLQTASNPYVAVLGPMESAAKRISIMGICNKVAGILAVYTLGSITLSNVDDLLVSLKGMVPAEKTIALDALAHKVVLPYTIIALILAALGVALLFVHLPEIREQEERSNTNVSVPRTSIFQFPHLLFGALAIFFYVGVEVISYDTFTGFGTALGFQLSDAKNFASYTGYGLLAGYLFGIAVIPSVISQRKALIGFTLLSIILVILSILTTGKVAVVCFALLGFSNSVLWPAIWPLAITGLGRFTKIGAALLIMGIVGGAVLPPLYGKLSEAIKSVQYAYLLMIPCYFYILWFGMQGYRMGDASFNVELQPVDPA